MSATAAKTAWTAAGVLALTLAAQAPAQAQVQETGASSDPIGALLDGQAPAPPAPRPAPAAVAPQATPVFVNEVGRTPDGPPTPTDRNYDARLRASFASAQGLQGPLDGQWTLSMGGGELYALQLVDAGGAPLEGAWRDIRRSGATAAASGFLADIQRLGSTVTFQFQPRPDGPMLTVHVSPGPDGRWTGEAFDGAARRPVSLQRD
ncbi:MAG: hypothetical protein ACK4YQ_02155 [Phenylobacterium sp.]|uniref:hypothetical protein n=1 Tax=Phenylobacterium sp. TaxID=1871053 RepID=UPI003918825B